MRKIILFMLSAVLASLMLTGCGDQYSDDVPYDEEVGDFATDEIWSNLEIVEIMPEVPSEEYTYTEDSIGTVSYNSKYGYLDHDGKVLVEPGTYIGSLGWCFSEGLAMVKRESGQQQLELVAIDTKGKEVFSLDQSYEINFHYPSNRYADCFHDQRIIIYNEHTRNYHIIDSSGNVINQFSAEGDPGMFRYSCNRLIVYGSLGGSWRESPRYFIKILDEMGEIVLSDFFIHSDAYNTNILYSDDHLSIPNEDGAWGVLDKNGEQVVDFTYEKLGYAMEGLIPFMRYGKWGYIDYVGNTVIEPQYIYASIFSEGLAAVQTDEGIGFIDRDNNMIISPAYYSSAVQNNISMNNLDLYLSYYRFTEYGFACIGPVMIDRQGNILHEAEIALKYSGGNIFSDGGRVFRVEAPR